MHKLSEIRWRLIALLHIIAVAIALLVYLSLNLNEIEYQISAGVFIIVAIVVIANAREVGRAAQFKHPHISITRLVLSFILVGLLWSTTAAYTGITPFTDVKEAITGLFSSSTQESVTSPAQTVKPLITPTPLITPSPTFLSYQGCSEGICVYENAKPCYLNLADNQNAVNPSWEQLKEFLHTDNTDEKAYIPEVYVCKDFAEEVHNNAEGMGIRAAYVSIEFTDGGPGHACNAFETTDRGYVFIDCTGQQTLITTTGTDCGHDHVSYLLKGKQYGLIDINFATGFSYEYYEYHSRQWDALDVKKAEYEDLHDKCGGYYSTYGKCSKLRPLYKELEELKAQLGCHWEPMGVVDSVEIYW